MAEMQKVSWRTVGYAALGTTALIAATIGIVHSDGVRPTSLKSSAATRWLVYQKLHLLVLADGLSGNVLAKIDADPKSDATGEFATQGAGGAFLVAPSLGTVRAVSTASLQLGTPQVVGALTASIPRTDLGVGANGLTVVNPKAKDAAIVAGGDVTRTINVPKADDALVARDGSMWLFGGGTATHVNVDESSRKFSLRGPSAVKTTVGSKGVTLDRKNGVVQWLAGGDVPITSLRNTADAILQEKGDDATCVWLAAGSTLACVGATGIDRTVQVAGLNVGVDDRLAVTGSVAAVVHKDNSVERIDLDTHTLFAKGNPTDVPPTTDLAVTATNGMIWIDDEDGAGAWVINQFGSVFINKADTTAPTVNAQGQVTNAGTGSAPDPNAGGNAPGTDAEQSHLDTNGVDDPPVANDDSVTARAGDTVTIPVTANDWDP
ncbi:MAG: large repetitive protein, partial [Ilumatobacteraceae bacterium]